MKTTKKQKTKNKKDPPGVEIWDRIPETSRTIYLANFEYVATGEGYTKEVQVLFKLKNTSEEDFIKSINVGVDISPYSPEIIPLIIDSSTVIAGKEIFFKQVNPEFKVLFLECFGGCVWGDFWRVCVEYGGHMDLVFKMHYNLS